MRTRYICCAALAVALVGTNVRAQAVPPIAIFPVSIQQTMTTGMVGLTANQTARLNVLNLVAVPATATNASANCTVQLQFFDAQNKELNHSVVNSFAPQTAASLDQTLPPQTIASLSPPPAPPRAQIRGVVTINPMPAPVGSPAVTGYCSVMISLEIFDTTTGSTVALTTDTRAIGSLRMVPFPLMP